MKVEAKIDIDTERIKTLKGFGNAGRVQRQFTREVAKAADNYTPYDTGRLKNIMLEIQDNALVYNADYAHKQYFTDMKHTKHNQSGLRGSHWVERAWADNKDKIIKNVKRELK